MSLTESVLMWIVSFLIFLVILYVCYKISYKLGIKKALYRTTYILLSIIFAFSITPYVNNELFNMDLTKFNITLTYKEESFTTIIDYVEEVIAHSDFLNDLYEYFPSLKDLFMDFPQVVLAPITYVLLFVLFMIIWFPLYLYLSYKRKRRVLYDREDKKSHRVWAGVLGAVQMVLIVSVVFSPINGINRIYQESIRNTLDDEYDSLCEGTGFLEEYKNYCDIVEKYDSTIFATIGSKNSLSDYVFDSLTRISYNGHYTNLSNEASLIVKSSIVLNQSGLLSVMETDSETIPVPLLIEKEFTDEDIDIIVDTLSNSKYSENLLIELEELVYNTLDGFTEQIVGEKTLDFNVSLTQDETIEEIKIVMKALPVLVNSSLISDIVKIKNIIEHFVYEVPENIKDERVIMAFIIDLAENIDLENLELLCEYLIESKIIDHVAPQIIDKVFGEFGFNFTATSGDLLDQIYNVIDFAKLVKKYKADGFLHFFKIMSDEDLVIAGDIFNYLSMSDDSRQFINFLFSTIFKDFDYYYTADIMNLNDWVKEAPVIRDICSIVHDIMYKDYVDVDRIIKVWKNKDSEAAEIGRNIIRSNTNYLVKEIVASLDK